MQVTKTGCVAWLFACLLPLSAAARLTLSADEETGLKKWQLLADDIEVELIQRLPDQTRGFFLARDFSSGMADEIAVNCIFQTIIRNTGQAEAAPPLSIDLGQWRLQHDGLEYGIKLKEPWLASWPEDKVSQASRLAFRWATFPTRQEFEPGDYNWGMTAFGLPPGASFDLTVVWQSGGEIHQYEIPAIECAPDVERLK